MIDGAYWTNQRMDAYVGLDKRPSWTVGNAAFGTLAAAVIHARYHRLPLTRGGKPVALTSVSDGNGGVLLTARWAK